LLWGYNYGEREIKASKFVIIVTACGLIVLNIIEIYQIVKSKYTVSKGKVC